jgi:hypothetical protein
MPRTFSLWQLMLGVTLFCIFCGLEVNVPLLAPTAGACFVLSSFSREWVPILLLGLFGFLVGLFLVDMPCVASRIPCDEFLLGIPPGFSALFFGGWKLSLEFDPPEYKANADQTTIRPAA